MNRGLSSLGQLCTRAFAVLQWRWPAVLMCVIVMVGPPTSNAQTDAEPYPLDVSFSTDKLTAIPFDQVWWTVELTNRTNAAVTDLTVEMDFDPRLTHFRMRTLDSGQARFVGQRGQAVAVTVGPGQRITIQFDTELRPHVDLQRPLQQQARIIYPDGRVQSTATLTVTLSDIPTTPYRWWWGLAMLAVGFTVAGGLHWWRQQRHAANATDKVPQTLYNG